ncbi:DUF2723 domain-containing protein [bacterium]|nr:DUF2723 domain-containing protein [bacterium]
MTDPVLPAPTAAAAEPFFSRRDKLAFWIATAVSLVGYVYTLAPSVTLEDSGEFLTAGRHLGVPHPPGYPIWTILAWIWQGLIPFGNIAWRVNLMSAVFGAVAIGLAALLISKTGHVLGHRVGYLQPLPGRLVDLIVLGSSLCGSLMLAFSPVMWSQSVISEVYSLNAFFLLLTLVYLYRWSFEPAKRWRLYLAAFIWGVSLTNHQTLVLLTVAFPMYVWRADRRLGRDILLPILVVIALAIGKMILFRNSMFYQGPFTGTVLALLGLGTVYWIYRLWDEGRGLFQHWRAMLATYGCVILGLSLYGYMHFSSLTNPPMNWGYCGTKTGFIHHFTRGQYEKLGTERAPLEKNQLGQPNYIKYWTNTVWRGWGQLSMFLDDLHGQFHIVLALLAMLALFFYHDFDQRDRDWLTFLLVAFIFLGLGFVFLSNPGFEKQKQFTDRVFFLPGHCLFVLWVGYGLIVAWGYAFACRTRLWPLGLGLAVVAFALFLLHKVQPRTSLHLLTMVCGAYAVLLLYADFLARKVLPRAGPTTAGVLALALMVLLPVGSVARNWADNEQRGHDFGYGFGYRMFKPGGGYPDMDRDAVLYGGTDPGRFVPTYMIFVESLAPSRSKSHFPKYPESATFDRSDVYIITQNALADHTYMSYVRDHYGYERPANTSFVQRLFGRDRTYPRDPIWIPSELDTQNAFSQYVKELQSRPPLPDEQVEIEGGRVSVQGVGGVMAINGILTKMIFDRNREKHSFYVEESYVIPWMYPYLEPHGIIMKINKDPLPGLTPAQLQRDRLYWDALFEELNADPVFHRDDVAQKTFSKLRSAIGGLFAFRGHHQEAEYAYRQAIQLCPDSPEANFRLAQLYVQTGQLPAARQVLETYHQRDPFNAKIREVIESVQGMEQAAISERELEQQYAQQPDNKGVVLQLAAAYARRNRFDALHALAQTFLARNDLTEMELLQLAQMYDQLRQLDRVTQVLTIMSQRYPRSALAWFNLASVLTARGQCTNATAALQQALALEGADGPMHQSARNDPRFAPCRQTPDFRTALGEPPRPISLPFAQ